MSDLRQPSRATSPRPAVSPKPYRGVSADARRAQRRRQLIEAAVSVYGERGYRNASVKAVCDAAGLTERYFYENFPNSEALLVAAFAGGTSLITEVIRASAKDLPIGATKVRAMLEAYYSGLKAEPVAARVFLTEIAGVSPAADKVVKAWRLAFADMLQAAWRGEPDSGGSLLKIGVMGALINIATAWVLDGYAHPLPEVVDAAFQVCTLLKG
jgi:AcrR family transcriptional regulator